MLVEWVSGNGIFFFSRPVEVVVLVKENVVSADESLAGENLLAAAIVDEGNGILLLLLVM